MTGLLLTQILDECEELLLTAQDFMKKKIRKLILNNNVLHDDVSKDILQVFEFDNPFEGMRTLNQQIDALKKHYRYIEPIEIPLGYRLDNTLDSETATYIPKMVMKICQYVSIIDSLKLVLSNEDVRQAILSERKSNDDNLLTSFLDGQHATIHPFHKHALRIQLFYDELEIVNPLGSKTGIHKLGTFYYTIQNLPPHINSELTKLESDEGIPIEIGSDHEFVLRGFLAAFTGNGLSVHDVYNFLGPSANMLCRMCLYTRADLHAGSVEPAEPRTEELFNQHLDLLEQTNFSAESKSTTRIRGDCSLHSSRYFHISRNKIFDPMHDFLCGICPMILKLILHEYILV
ncbi:hypothetical protein ALC57_13147 [Trachymyrmex cornetzi]|uniref:Uncharacterized protein n=1 Tax=Trachymyrmex cornetzi TaxID=471704 RepID=A0A151IZW6_9HYME|nr:hypothetical protein ALC57_13147 [Trachymyrmex cornetzi]